MRHKIKIFLLLNFLFSGLSVSGQWSTQTINLKPGWNGVYLHVDASYSTINDLAGLDENIEEIWLWKPESTDAQFIKSPDSPTNQKSRWLSWTKKKGPSSSLQRLIGNSAYLVRFGSTNNQGKWVPSSNKNWDIKGRPVPPAYNWTSTGLNLIGFPSDSTSAPSIDSYFPQGVMNDLEFFKYSGGNLSEINPVPDQVFALRNTIVKRGEAFWVRSKSGKFNNYFSAFDIVLQDYRGVVYGQNRGQYRIIIRNRTNRGLVVAIKHNETESAPIKPDGVNSYSKGMKLMIRGELNPVNLTYTHSNLNAGDSHQVTLAAAGKPGSSKEIIIGLDRSSMAGAAGGKSFGALLELSDSLGHTEMILPASAIKTANTGLWVGTAKINEVRHDLTFFKENPVTKSIQLDSSGKAQIMARNDNYGKVANPYPLRLILHQGEELKNGLKLFQTIYHGVQKGAEQLTQTILTTNESDLEPTQLASARRVSSVHLPWRKNNTFWTCAGQVSSGESVVVSVKTDYNDHSSNPFLHTYSPDHDNIDARFKKEQLQGVESFGIIRDIRLNFDPVPKDFDSLTKLQRRLEGKYTEIITLEGTGSEKTHYFTRGTFFLNRISTHTHLGADGAQSNESQGSDVASENAHVPTYAQGRIGAKLYYALNLIKPAVPALYFEEGDDIPEGKKLGDIKSPALPAVYDQNTLYAGINGLTSHANYPDSPDQTFDLPYFEFPNLAQIDKIPHALDHKDHYGSLIQGYFHPDKTGWYRFSLSSTDEGQLWLSPDSSQKNKKLIATAKSKKTRDYSNAVSQSAPIHLQRGGAYYIETVHRETTGGDSISVSFHYGKIVSLISDFSDGDLPIAGKYLSPYKAPAFVANTGNQFQDEEGDGDGDEGGDVDEGGE